MLHPPTSLPAAASASTGQETAAGEPLVRFRGVQKTYDGVHVVVQHLDLDIRRGEFLTLLGPSGSGKTTTLMMLAGFESPTAGDIVLDGRPITRTPPHKRHFGMVFQNHALFPHLSVGGNVAYPLTVRKVAKAEQEQRRVVVTPGTRWDRGLTLAGVRLGDEVQVDAAEPVDHGWPALRVQVFDID